jgi:hypothetical protein
VGPNHAGAVVLSVDNGEFVVYQHATDTDGRYRATSQFRPELDYFEREALDYLLPVQEEYKRALEAAQHGVPEEPVPPKEPA